jgi:hypothetical protein
MKCLVPLLLLAVLVVSCHHGYEFRDISEFNLKPGALQDMEPVKLLYSSQAPGNNDNLGYYVQLIAISQKTGDTVNILTTWKTDLYRNDGDTIYYFGPDIVMTRAIQMSDKEIQNNPGAIESHKLKDIRKVASDPKFDHIARNYFPTVIGSIRTKGAILTD